MKHIDSTPDYTRSWNENGEETMRIEAFEDGSAWIWAWKQGLDGERAYTLRFLAKFANLEAVLLYIRHEF